MSFIVDILGLASNEIRVKKSGLKGELSNYTSIYFFPNFVYLFSVRTQTAKYHAFNNFWQILIKDSQKAIIPSLLPHLLQCLMQLVPHFSLPLFKKSVHKRSVHKQNRVRTQTKRQNLSVHQQSCPYANVFISEIMNSTSDTLGNMNIRDRKSGST